MTDKLKKLCKDGKKRTRLIFILGAAGVLLIAGSELLPDKNSADTAQQSELTIDESERYRENIEKQLTGIISQISGVGEADVMITVSGTKEYVYAEQYDVSRKSQSGGEDTQQSGQVILAGAGGKTQPVLKKIMTPQISGAVVVCEGANDDRTRERVVNAVSAALGLPSTKISVEPSR